MSNTRIPSPARSQGLLTPRRYKSRGTRSVGSPARSTASGRLSAVIMQDSFCPLSPLPTRRSVLNDDTAIEEPRRKSWWKKLKENSRDVIEVLDTSKVRANYETIEEMLNVEVLSQEKKNYSLDLPDSSDNESINSIIMPQRKLFIQKENVPQVVHTNTETVHNKSASAKTKLIQKSNKPRTKPVFPSALLNISPDKTVADKTNDIVDLPANQVRNIFGKRPATKRKNIFTGLKFIVSESEDEVSEIQPKIFAFQKQPDHLTSISASRPLRESSPALSITNAMDLDDWKHLPSSTMVDNQLEFAATPGKKARLSKLSEALESEAGTFTNATNKTKNTTANNKSINKSKTEKVKEKSAVANTSMTTRHRAKFSNFLIEEDKSISPNKSQAKKRQEAQNDSSNITKDKSNHTNIQNTSTKNVNKSKIHLSQHQIATEQSDDENNFSLEYDKSDSDSNNASNESQIKINTTLTSKTNHSKSVQPNASEKDNKQNTSLKNKTNKTNIEQIVKSLNQQNSSQTQFLSIGKQQEMPCDENINRDNTHETVLKANNSMKNVSIQQKHTEAQKKLSEKKIDQNTSLCSDKQTGNNLVQDSSDVDSTPNDKVDNRKKTDAQSQLQNDQDAEMDIDLQELKDKTTSEINADETDHSKNGAENKCGEQEDVEMECETSDVEQAAEYSEQNHENSEEQDNSDQEVDDHEDEEANENNDDDMNNSDLAAEEQISEDNEESGNVIAEKSGENNEEQEHINDSNEATDHITGDSNNENHMENSEQNMADSSIDDNNGDDECHNTTENQEQDSNQEIENDEESDEQNDESVENDDENQESLDQEIENDEESDEQNDDENQESHDQESDNSAQVEIPASDSDNETDNVENEATEPSGTPKEPEAVLRNKNHSDSLTPPGPDNSLRKTKSMMLKSMRPSLFPPRESTIMSDGPSNSSAEGSGWDSHRTTRKTLRQTFGKDFTPRKSLRALVMEKSAKRQTTLNNAYEISKVPQANSTELPDFNDYENTVEPSLNETHNRQETVEERLQKIRQMQMKRNMRVDQEVSNFLKTLGQRKPLNDNVFKVPTKPIASRRSTKTIQSRSKAKTLKPSEPLTDLPIEFIEDMKYKPPKRYQPKGASWSTKWLYKFLEDKLEPKYDYKARVRAEKLVDTIYQFTKDIKKHDVAPLDAVDVLKHEMARLNIVKTHFEFYEFFNDFMPREIRVKVIPDIVNNIPSPRNGIFSNIINNHSTSG